jgi:acyl-ACP thioesterase
MGAGFYEMRERGLFWVLSRLYIEMEQYPLWDQEVVITSWPRPVESVFAPRDFEGHDLSGNRCALASSQWLIVDGHTHRIQRPDVLYQHFSLCTRHVLPQALEKIIPDGPLTPSGVVQARLFDVDIQSHVNNVRYLTWAIEYLPEEEQYPPIKSAELNFLSEAMLGDSVEMCYTPVEEHRLCCALQQPGTGKEYARCRLVFEH